MPPARVVGRYLATPALLIIITVLVAVVANQAGDASLRRIIVAAVINMVAVIGIYVFVGLTGVFSFGQMGFMAIGAYSTAILTVPVASKSALFKQMPDWMVDLHFPTLIAILIGGLVAGLVALILSVPMSRMNDLTASLATLAILVAVYVVAGNWSSVTNGARGITAIPTDTTLTSALIIAAITIAGVWIFQESGLGLRIRATREDAIAARAIGISVGRMRGIAFVFSGFIVGIAGGMYSHLQGNLSPDAFYIGPTFLLVAMLVVGGLNSLTGAVIGTIVITALRRFLQTLEKGFSLGPLDIPGRPGLTEVGLGVALLLILAFRSGGISGGREFSGRSFGRLIAKLTGRRHPTDAAPDPALLKKGTR